MEYFEFITDWLLHIDKHLLFLCTEYKEWIYIILFLIIFSETGLIFMPFLPGDSLLFAAGALAGKAEQGLSVPILLISLIIAAIAGDFLNYLTGRFFGKKLTARKWLKARYMEGTTDFFKKHGKSTIILARFLPIVRTFAPFIAGIGKMPYRIFAFFNISGGILWISTFILAGYCFGNIPIIRDNFSIVVLVIIVLSNIPLVFSFLKRKLLRINSPKV